MPSRASSGEYELETRWAIWLERWCVCSRRGPGYIEFESAEVI